MLPFPITFLNDQPGAGSPPPLEECDWIDDLGNIFVDDIGNNIVFTCQNPDLEILTDDQGNIFTDDLGNQIIIALP